MRSGTNFLLFISISLSACGISLPIAIKRQESKINQNAQLSEATLPELPNYQATLYIIPTLTPLPGSCSTPKLNQLNDFLNRSITIKDSGKSMIVHVTSRFWIYLDDINYPLFELLKSIPNGLIGYVSNGSIRGPQCYPIMFEAVQEGRGLIQINNFQLFIIINNSLPESSLPLN
jgi:hypothetical protein